jgi:hypothetical protein
MLPSERLCALDGRLIAIHISNAGKAVHVVPRGSPSDYGSWNFGSWLRAHNKLSCFPLTLQLAALKISFLMFNHLSWAKMAPYSCYLLRC